MHILYDSLLAYIDDARNILRLQYTAKLRSSVIKSDKYYAGNGRNLHDSRIVQINFDSNRENIDIYM